MRGSIAKMIRRDVYGKVGKIPTQYFFAKYTTSITPMQARLIRLVGRIPKYGKKLSRRLFTKLHKVVPLTVQRLSDVNRQKYQHLKSLWKSYNHIEKRRANKYMRRGMA